MKNYLIFLFLLTVVFGCKKDPYYNPDFRQGEYTSQPVFYIKAKMLGDANFNNHNGDSLKVTGGEHWEISINVDTPQIPADTANSYNFGSQFRPTFADDDEYKFYVSVNVPFRDKNKLVDYLNTHKSLQYATNSAYIDKVKIAFSPPKEYFNFYDSFAGPDTLNQNSYFTIISAENYTDPVRPNEKLVKVKAKFSCNTVDRFNHNRIVKLTGEMIALF